MIVLLFIVLWIALTLFALTFGVVVDWPDYVHVNYGFPFVWSIHTLNTIVGPVDKWQADISALLFDLLLWQGVMVIVVAAMLLFDRKG